MLPLLLKQPFTADDEDTGEAHALRSLCLEHTALLLNQVEDDEDTAEDAGRINLEQF